MKWISFRYDIHKLALNVKKCSHMSFHKPNICKVKAFQYKLKAKAFKVVNEIVQCQHDDFITFLMVFIKSFDDKLSQIIIRKWENYEFFFYFKHKSRIKQHSKITKKPLFKRLSIARTSNFQGILNK